MFSVSTHVLDTGSGLPAAGIEVALNLDEADGTTQVGLGVTDDDGRIGCLGEDLAAGIYHLVFDTGSSGSRFYPSVVVSVRLDGDRPHYHLPLLLNEYGYTTYRGS